MLSHSTFSRERRGLWKDYRALLFFGTVTLSIPSAYQFYLSMKAISFLLQVSDLDFCIPSRDPVSSVYQFLPLSLSFPVSPMSPVPDFLSLSFFKCFVLILDITVVIVVRIIVVVVVVVPTRNTTRSSSTRPTLDNIRSSIKAEHYNSCQMNTQETSSLFVSTMI